MALLVTWFRAVILFYRSIAPFTLSISGLILGVGLLPALLEGEGQGGFPLVVLIKLGTGPVVWYLAEQARPHQYWFFYNLGISRRSLWAGVALLDTLLFVGAAQGLLAAIS